MPWEPIILHPFEGEKRLFKIGLMTFKAPSSKTDGHFAFIETELPPGASVERHQHSEAEMFYILSGQFDFWIAETSESVRCRAGAFLLVPPHVSHAFANTGEQSGMIFGMLAPAKDGGLESFFRAMSIPIDEGEEALDMNQPVERVQEIIAQRSRARRL
jgi:quercetin dioxygenase-like cupin family protein